MILELTALCHARKFLWHMYPVHTHRHLFNWCYVNTEKCLMFAYLDLLVISS